MKFSGVRVLFSWLEVGLRVIPKLKREIHDFLPPWIFTVPFELSSEHYLRMILRLVSVSKESES